ncbi:MAG TPA: ubiquitin-like protein Pup [Candidatus Limnocylindria bacterium]|nr:ubiquitin-like protein Pup [Candidatus Limnocylindria bacterium]
MATRETGGGQDQVGRRDDAAAETATEAAAQDVAAAETAERKAALDDEVDAILDEIDEVLETNSEEFVRGFVQKGGQ